MKTAHLTCLSVLAVSVTATNVCHAQFNTIINVPPDPVPSSIGSNTQLNLSAGGTLLSSILEEFESGASDGSSTNVEVNIMGGRVGEFFQANSGSVVNISGGEMGNYFDLNFGSELNVSGGTLGQLFSRQDDTELAFFGGEFRLNGNATTGDTVVLDYPDILTGTLEDGSPFIFQSHGDIDLVDAPLPPLDTTPMTVDSENAPTGLRSGQTLTLLEGGLLGNNFAAVNATLNIAGGTVGRGLQAAGSRVKVLDGQVGYLEVFSGSVINISGGIVGVGRDYVFPGLAVREGGQATLTGGTVIDFNVHGNAVIAGGIARERLGAVGRGNVVMSSGTVERLVVSQGGRAVLSGGDVATIINHEGELHLFGREFLLDNQELSLTPAEAFLIEDRDVELAGILADGTPFSFNLNSMQADEDFVSPDATLILTEIGSIAGDADGNGTVDFADFLVLSSNFGQAGQYADGDFDWNGKVEFPDFLILAENFGEATVVSAVPEPSSYVVILIALACCGRAARNAGYPTLNELEK